MILDRNSSRHVVLSGCSGGGKSTLLADLADRGFTTVPEPGRRIVMEEQGGDGKALPWVDPAAFARRAIAVAAQDRDIVADYDDWVFFDRGLVDAAVALQHATGEPASMTMAVFPPYHSQVFLTPPWPEIYVSDHERRHDLLEAIAEYERLVIAYRDLGYETIILPKSPVAERTRNLLSRLGCAPRGA
jgi:predicted ATPase